MMRRFDAPSERAASMNSFSRIDSTCPRMIRPMYGHDASAITTISVVRPGVIRPPRQPLPSAHAEARPIANSRTGKGENDVHQARQQRVDPAAEEARDRADRDPDQDRDTGGDERDLQRDLRPVDHAGEDVATELVDAERVRGARTGRLAEDVERALRAGAVVVRRVGPGDPEQLDDRPREDGHEDQDHDEDQRRHRDSVRAEAPPEQLHRRAGNDLARPRGLRWRREGLAPRPAVRSRSSSATDWNSAPQCGSFLHLAREYHIHGNFAING